jgi:hypothetical protein
MGGGGFRLLKTGGCWPETEKRPKGGLAGICKILSVSLTYAPTSGTRLALTVPYR